MGVMLGNQTLIEKLNSVNEGIFILRLFLPFFSIIKNSNTLVLVRLLVGIAALKT